MLRAEGRKLGVVASSRITAYKVHSFYVFQTVELAWKSLAERSLKTNLVRRRIKDINTIVWDKASMSSQPMLEPVNSLHYHLSSDDSKLNLFAGKQVMLVGEFLQLKPIPKIVLTRVISCSSSSCFVLHYRVDRCNVADTNRPNLFSVLKK